MREILQGGRFTDVQAKQIFTSIRSMDYFVSLLSSPWQFRMDGERAKKKKKKEKKEKGEGCTMSQSQRQKSYRACKRGN